MQPILIIVESPNKSKKIDEMFAGRFKALASYGHVCDLPRSPKQGIGINRDTMQGEYELTEDSKRHVDGNLTISKLRLNHAMRNVSVTALTCMLSLMLQPTT